MVYVVRRTVLLSVCDKYTVYTLSARMGCSVIYVELLMCMVFFVCFIFVFFFKQKTAYEI